MSCPLNPPVVEVTTPLMRTSPRTESFDVGTTEPIPRLPPIKTPLLIPTTCNTCPIVPVEFAEPTKSGPCAAVNVEMPL